MDLFSMLAQATKLMNAPGTEDLFASLPRFFTDATAFMRYFRERIGHVENRLESIDSKLTILIAETNLTPELHGEIIVAARRDPRNSISSMERIDNG